MRTDEQMEDIQEYLVKIRKQGDSADKFLKMARSQLEEEDAATKHWRKRHLEKDRSRSRKI